MIGGGTNTRATTLYGQPEFTTNAIALTIKESKY